MMRLLIATIVLLAWTATASAECAWVLWQEASGSSQATGYFIEYGISLASSSEQEGRKVATQQLRAHEAMLRRPGPNGKTPQVEVEGPYVRHIYSGGILTYRYFCLPDTVDPRGPKSK